MPRESKPRSGVAVAAQHRRAGTMHHRLAPRGGARNAVADLLDEVHAETASPGKIDAAEHDPHDSD